MYWEKDKNNGPHWFGYNGDCVRLAPEKGNDKIPLFTIQDQSNSKDRKIPVDRGFNLHRVTSIFHPVFTETTDFLTVRYGIKKQIVDDVLEKVRRQSAKTSVKCITIQDHEDPIEIIKTWCDYELQCIAHNLGMLVLDNHDSETSKN